MAFVAAFVFYYFAFLVFETRFFLRFEAKLKLSKQVKNEKNTVHSIDAAAVVGNSDNDAEGGDRGEEDIDVNELIFGHIGDAYEWHVVTVGDTHLTIRSQSL